MGSNALWIGGGILAYLWWRGRPAGAAPVVREDGMRSVGTETENARALLARYESIIRDYDSPMPPGALALILWRESRGNPKALAPRGAAAFWECGLAQLTIAVEDGRGEAMTYDVDPWDARSSIYAVQRSYAADYEWLRGKLTDAGRPLHPDDPVDDAVSLMALSRSVGRAGVVRLAGAVPQDIWDGFATGEGWMTWLADHYDRIPSRLGVQSRELLERRLRKAAKVPDEGRRVEEFPAQLDAPNLDRDGVKPWPLGAINNPAKRARLKRWVESKGATR